MWAVMRDVVQWSVSCCRDADVDVRLHASLFLTLAGFVFLSVQSDAPAAVTAIAVMAYLLSLAAREAARAFTSWKWGGRVECVLLGPLGALNDGPPHEDSRGDLAVAAIGPATNMAIALVSTVTLAAFGQSVLPLLFPLAPPEAARELSAIGCLSWLAWINGVLAVAACIPTYPLDGARFVMLLIRQRLDDRAAIIPTARLGIAAAVVVLISAFFVGRGYSAALLGLMVLGIVGFFCSRRELLRGLAAADGDDDVFDEPSPYETDDPRPHIERVGPFRRWWRARQEAKLRLRVQIEREEESRADELLVRVHLEGMHSLSAQERALLQRVSARYRQRH
jgi:Zn-dependent protease